MKCGEVAGEEEDGDWVGLTPQACLHVWLAKLASLVNLLRPTDHRSLALFDFGDWLGR